MVSVEILWKINELKSMLELNDRAKGDVDILAKKIHYLKQRGRGEVINYERLISGLSDKTRNAVKDIIIKGKSDYVFLLSKKAPIGLLSMLVIPELEAWEIRYLNETLGIENIEDLRRNAKKRRLRKLTGFSSKRELSILRSIKLLLNPPATFPSALAKPLGDNFLKDMQLVPGVKRFELVGSLRRGADMVDKIEILVGADEKNEITKILCQHPLFTKILDKKPSKLVAKTNITLIIEVEVVNSSMYWFKLHEKTGSTEYLAEFNKHMQRENTQLKDTKIQSEREIYDLLHMQYVEPELRENKEVVYWAAEGTLPVVISQNEYQGDLHSHTKWSDGIGSIEEMARAAIEQNYKYLAITEHTKSLKVAGGISELELERQMEEIDMLNSVFVKEDLEFRLLKGIEVDILKNGELDFSNDILDQMDLVIASVHTDFDQKREDITERIIKALEHPSVNILAHPTGRILGRRSGYDVDLEKVFQAAKSTNTILEINSSPDRLDLNAEYAKLARDMGIKIAINTDSHDPSRLTDISYGIKVAKKAWLKAEDVINCLDLEKLKEFLKIQKQNK